MLLIIDAREKKGLIGDLQSFSFSLLDQDKNFIAGVGGVSLWGSLYITSLLVDIKIIEIKITEVY
ncbi:N-acetyltransferase [Rickettsia endosymbiont of Rhinocyllus conicus]|uniref:N-acetyltransferase n=1 Tax=Rickettsia endosymbiont of Rhinocyllus conicus TaxID=3066252 RepID=UPI00313343CF